MKKQIFDILVFPFLLSIISILPKPADAQELSKKWFPGHYVSIRHNDYPLEQGSRNLVKDNPYITGYKVHILWSEIETSKDNYNFSVLQNFLNVAEADGKKLLISLQDRNYGGNNNPFLPQYMLTSEYEGGWYYSASSTASYPKYFLTKYQERWNKYLSALATFVDDNQTVAVIVNQETAIPGLKDCPGYTQDGFVKYLKSTDSTMANNFKNTIFCQYVNWLHPSTVRDDIMKHQVEVCKNGFGGPDLNDGGGTWTHEMQFGPYYTKYRGVAPICVENQPSGYKTETAQIIFDYAVDNLGVHFLPWASYKATDRAYNINDVLEVINKEKGRINTAPPSNIISTGASNNQSASGKYSIYPNPAEDEVMLNISDDHPDGSYTYQLMDITGKLIDSQIIINSSTIIPSSKLVKGTYFLRMIDKNRKSEILKFIKI